MGTWTAVRRRRLCSTAAPRVRRRTRGHVEGGEEHDAEEDPSAAVRGRVIEVVLCGYPSSLGACVGVLHARPHKFQKHEFDGRP